MSVAENNIQKGWDFVFNKLYYDEQYMVAGRLSFCMDCFSDYYMDKTVTDKDGNTAHISMPCLNIKLGEYHALGDYMAEVGNFPKWNGQIHTYTEVLKLYGK